LFPDPNFEIDISELKLCDELGELNFNKL
jgi:hypothetical protein